MIVTMHKKVREMQCHTTSAANQLQNLLEYRAYQSFKQSKLAHGTDSRVVSVG